MLHSLIEQGILLFLQALVALLDYPTPLVAYHTLHILESLIYLPPGLKPPSGKTPLPTTPAPDISLCQALLEDKETIERLLRFAILYGTDTLSTATDWAAVRSVGLFKALLSSRALDPCHLKIYQSSVNGRRYVDTSAEMSQDLMYFSR